MSMAMTMDMDENQLVDEEHYGVAGQEHPDVISRLYEGLKLLYAGRNDRLVMAEVDLVECPLLDGVRFAVTDDVLDPRLPDGDPFPDNIGAIELQADAEAARADIEAARADIEAARADIEAARAEI